MTANDVELRLRRLENACMNPKIAGTTICRFLDGKDGGLHWSLAIGAMSMPKKFYIGKSIEEIVRAAEKDILKV